MEASLAYQAGKPILSDTEFDELKGQLRKKNSKVVSQVGPCPLLIPFRGNSIGGRTPKVVGKAGGSARWITMDSQVAPNTFHINYLYSRWNVSLLCLRHACRGQLLPICPFLPRPVWI